MNSDELERLYEHTLKAVDGVGLEQDKMLELIVLARKAFDLEAKLELALKQGQYWAARALKLREVIERAHESLKERP